MKDLVTRLRTWVHAVDAVPASDLMDQAADEIERLRGYRDAAEADLAVAMTAADRLKATITSLSGDRGLFQNLARQFAEHATRAKKRIEELEAIRRSNNNLRADLEAGLQDGVVRLQNEVRRLEGVIAARQPTLTDEEREAVEFFSTMAWPKESQQIKARAAMLRSLLERTK